MANVHLPSNFSRYLRLQAVDKTFLHRRNLFYAVRCRSIASWVLVGAFHEAVDDYIETCGKAGKKPERPFSGKLMLRVDPAVHAKSVEAAELAGKSLNQWNEEVRRRAAG